MMNGIKSGTELSDRLPDRRSARREREGAEPSILDDQAQAEPPPAPGSDLRLLIEKDARGDDYVYKLIDRTTGAVIAERPREQVAALADGPGYRAGAVISTKA